MWQLKRNRRGRISGFTLIELLLVLVILGVLAGVVVPKLINQADKSKVTAAVAAVGNLTTAIDTFNINTGRLPTTDEGLNALVKEPSDVKDWRGPYIDAAKLKDPWDQPYHYSAPGAHNPNGYDVYSTGPDKQEGTPDDIGNWEMGKP